LFTSLNLGERFTVYNADTLNCYITRWLSVSRCSFLSSLWQRAPCDV